MSASMRAGRDRLRVTLWAGFAGGLMAMALTAGNLEDLWPVFNTGALAVVACPAALAVRWARRSRFWHPAAMNMLASRLALENRERLNELEVWRAVHTDRIAVNEQRTDGLYQVMAEANAAMELPDPDATTPMAAVRLLRPARGRAS